MIPLADPVRLKKLLCPGCLRWVILEPWAKAGDVILCPWCTGTLIIARVAERLELHRWRETAQRLA